MELKLKIHMIYCVWLCIVVKYLLYVHIIVKWKFSCIFAYWSGLFLLHGCMLRCVFFSYMLHVERIKLIKKKYKSVLGLHFKIIIIMNYDKMVYKKEKQLLNWT